MNVALAHKEGILNLIRVYAPNISKPKEHKEAFHRPLQDEINKTPKRSKILLGDLTPRFGDHYYSYYNNTVINDSP